MRWRLLAVALVLAAALADAAGQYGLAYYALVAAVPVAATAALSALGAILDGTAAEPLDRAATLLAAVALPILLLATVVRAPVAPDAAPPTLGVNALAGCLVLFALQAVLSGAAVIANAGEPAVEAD